MNKKVLTLCAAMLLSGSSLVPLYADNSFEPTSISSQWKMDFNQFVKYYSSSVSYNEATKTLTVNDEVTYSDLHKFLLIDEDNVVLDGQGKTWNGRIVVTGENVIIKNLTIDYKNAFVPDEDATVIENKSAITVFASNVTIDGCKIKCSVEHPKNYMANGIVLYPLTQKPIFKITNTTISGANSIVESAGWPDAPSFGIQILGNLKDETSNGFTYFQSDKFTNSASNLDLSNCVFPESDAYVNCATDFGYIEVTGMVPGETKDAESYKIVSVQKNSNNELAVKKAITNAVDNAIVKYSGTSDDLMRIMKDVTVTNNVAVQCGGDQVNVLYSNATAPDNNWESISVSSTGETVQDAVWADSYEAADGKSLTVVLVHKGGAVKTILEEDGSIVYTLGEYKPSSTDDVNLPAMYHFTLSPRMNDAGNYELRLVDCYGNDFRVNGHVVTVSNVAIDKNGKGEWIYNGKTLDQSPIPTELELKAGDGFVTLVGNAFDVVNIASDAQKFGTAKISIANIYAEDLLKRHGDHFTLKITYKDSYQNDIDVTGVFTGNLRPCYVYYNAGEARYSYYTGKDTYYMLANEKGEIIALDKDEALLEGKEGFGYALKTISPKEYYLDTERYLVWFDMEYTPGQDVNSLTAITKINLGGYTVGLQKNSKGEIVLVAAAKANLLASPTISIKLNEGSVVTPSAWLTKPVYYTVKSINKKTNSVSYGRFAGKALGLEENGYIKYVDTENVDLTKPEGQFAIIYDGEGKVYRFVNREVPTAGYYTDIVLDEDKLYQIDATTFAYVNGTTTPDTLSIEPVSNYSSEDGFKRFSPAELNANTYTVSMKLLNGSLLNIIEKHNDKHRLGLDEDNATEWRIEMPTVKLLDNTGDFLRYAADTISNVTAIKFYADGDWRTTQIDNPKDKYYYPNTELRICTYILKNTDTNEYLNGKDYDESTGNAYYVCNEDEKTATRIAFKLNGEGAVNLVPVSTWTSGNSYYEPYKFNGQLSGYKIQGGASGDVLKDADLYEATANDLFVINVAEAPTYKKMEQGDKIILSLKNNTENVLVEGPVDGFATMSNREAHKDLNPTLYVDTAYVNRDGNYAYQYLLGVRINRVDTTYECNVPAHGTHRADTTFGYFLVNMIDSAKACTDVHNNKFVYNEDYKLDFVKGYHTNDTLFFTNDADEVISSMKIGDASYNMAKFAFKMIDEEANEFVIETGKGYDKQTVKKGSTWATVTNEVTTPSYLRWVNGNLVVTDNIDDAAHFTMEASDKEATANEAISAGNVVVAGTNGAVVVKGAEGKNVIVSTILGKVVANEVVSSDNAQITAPAGIVVVSVDGESFKVVVK